MAILATFFEPLNLAASVKVFLQHKSRDDFNVQLQYAAIYVFSAIAAGHFLKCLVRGLVKQGKEVRRQPVLHMRNQLILV